MSKKKVEEPKLSKNDKNDKNPNEPELNYEKVQEFWSKRKATKTSPHVLIDGGLKSLGFPESAISVRHEGETEFVQKYVKEAHKDMSKLHVLDLGSGMGYWTDYFVTRLGVKKVFSVEASKVYFDAQTKLFKDNKKVKVFFSNVLDFSTDEKFDVIFLGGLLMYLNENDVVKLLNSCDNFLRDSSSIVICRESTYSKTFAKKGKYSVLYRTVQHYKNIFLKTKVFHKKCEMNMAYIQSEIVAEIMVGLKKVCCCGTEGTSGCGGVLTYLGGRALYGLYQINPWKRGLAGGVVSMTDKVGLRFPLMRNHYFVLGSRTKNDFYFPKKEKEKKKEIVIE